MTAPVTLVTGLPGNGKTLYTVCMVKEWAEKENRQVYVNGIEILDKAALPWIEFDANEWHTLPHGAIIVIDESHKTFPVRPTGSKVPPHVEAIAELRHQGHNLVIITQHPMELDSAVRRRVGRHLHCVRRFGMQACAIREWSRVVENCDKTAKDAIVHEWVYNKAAYGWYKSAEIHTIKRKLPAKLLWLAVAPVVLIAAVVYMVHLFQVQRSGQSIKAAIAANGGSVSASGPSVLGGSSGGSGGPLTRDQYVKSFVPRIQGLAYTAPAYDQVTKPVHAPYPAACVESKDRCQCYTQQGTRLDSTKDMCHSIAQGGFFMAWDDVRRDVQRQAVAPAVAASSALPVYGPGGGLAGFNYVRVASTESASVLAPSGSVVQPGRGPALPPPSPQVR